MLNRIGVAIGAGLASALLFAVTVKGTAAAMALAYFTPLPIMIIALGWGLQADAIAVVAAGAIVAAVIEPDAGLKFTLAISAPAGLLAGLAALDRLDPFDRASPPAKPFQAGPGLIALSAAALGFAISAGAIATMMIDHGGYDQAAEAFRHMLEPTLDDATTGGADLPEGFTLEDINVVLVKFAPAALAGSVAVMLIVNLYIAARVAQVSQRLARPWLDIPTTMSAPALAGVVAFAALAAWYLAPEPYAAFAAALGAPLALVFVMQGLAVLHALVAPHSRPPGADRGALLRPHPGASLGRPGAVHDRAPGKRGAFSRPGAKPPRLRSQTSKPKESDMEVILLERVGKLGHMGDTVKVKDGYARNYLLPRGKALRATEANRKKFEDQRRTSKRATWR